MKTTRTAETIPGTLAVAQRIVTGEDDFITALADLGGITRAEAERVFAYYLRHRLAKRGRGFRVQVKHGSFLDREVIRKCAAVTAA